MVYDLPPAEPRSADAHLAAPSFPHTLWLAWALSIVGTATWIAWPALRGVAPLDLARLIITSLLVGVAGLLVLTIIEIRIAPWRFFE